MRKKFATFQASPRRLLSLLLMQTFVALAVPFVDGSSTKLIDIVNIEKITGGPSLVKTYELLSACSDLRVQMRFNRVINAKGRQSTAFTRFDFLSDSTGSGRIRIKGNRLHKFLCFSRNGKLINRTHGDNVRCMFNEVPHNNHIMLKSVANASWYVGFNKHGKKVMGYAKKDRWRREKCFMFLKTEWPPNSNSGSRSQKEKFVNSVGNSIEHGYHGNR